MRSGNKILAVLRRSKTQGVYKGIGTALKTILGGISRGIRGYSKRCKGVIHLIYAGDSKEGARSKRRAVSK